MPGGRTVTVYDEQGNLGDIPEENYAEALKVGAVKPAMRYTDSSGNTNYFPVGSQMPQGASNVGLAVNSDPNQPTFGPVQNATLNALKGFYLPDIGNNVPGGFRTYPQQISYEYNQFKNDPLGTLKADATYVPRGIVQPMQQTFNQARQDFAQGNPGVGTVRTAESFIPVFGPQASQAYNQYQSGDKSGAIGTELGMGLQMATMSPETLDTAINPLKSMGSRLVNALGPSGEPAITAAVNPPKNVRANFRQAVQQVGPELQGVSSVEDLRDLAAQKRAEAGQKMDSALQQAGLNNMLNMKAIQNAIVRTNMGRTAQAAGTDAAIEDFAKKYTAFPMSVAEASNELNLINSQLSSMRRMTPSERLTYLNQNPQMAALQNIKDNLSSQIEGFAGNPAFRSANAEYARWRTIQDTTQQSLDDMAAKGGNVQRKGAVPKLVTFGANTLPAVGAGLGEAVGGWSGAGVGGGVGMLARDAIVSRFANPDYLVQRGAASFGAPSTQVVNNPYFNFTRYALPAIAGSNQQR